MASRGSSKSTNNKAATKYCRIKANKASRQSQNRAIKAEVTKRINKAGSPRKIIKSFDPIEYSWNIHRLESLAQAKKQGKTAMILLTLVLGEVWGRPPAGNVFAVWNYGHVAAHLALKQPESLAAYSS